MKQQLSDRIAELFAWWWGLVLWVGVPVAGCWTVWLVMRPGGWQ